jgi:2',3'-cyclic-nucleotide 2'-phosphodiesterase (5'-nucleotidase family)
VRVRGERGYDERETEMGPRVLHYSDVENAFDRPERVGRLAGTLREARDEGSGGTEAIVVGTAPGALALERRGRQALAFFDRIGPDAQTFGNHDFDYSRSATHEVVREQRDFRLATNGYVVYSDEFETLDVGDARELHGMQYEAFIAYARTVDLELGLDGRFDVVGE